MTTAAVALGDPCGDVWEERLVQRRNKSVRFVPNQVQLLNLFINPNGDGTDYLSQSISGQSLVVWSIGLLVNKI